jgi:subtilisin family serine protease
VRLWAVQVLKKNGSGSVSEGICGVDWVTSTLSDSDPSNDIVVANMSWAAKGEDDGNCGTTSKDALHLAICNSVAAGVTYVAAAGNEGTDFQSTRPAAYDEVITATASPIRRQAGWGFGRQFPVQLRSGTGRRHGGVILQLRDGSRRPSAHRCRPRCVHPLESSVREALSLSNLRGLTDSAV